MDHPGREMGTWVHSSSSIFYSAFYERVLAGEANSKSELEFGDHKLVMIIGHLGDRPRLAWYWNFNTYLVEIRESQSQQRKYNSECFSGDSCWE